MSDNTYQPAKVWTWEKSNGGAFANINRPVSGATHEKTLPVGKHPLQLYSLGTPNGQKVTIMLEELLAQGVKGAEYDAWIIRIGDGDQFSSGFVEVNPNSKIPALRDHSQKPTGSRIRIWRNPALSGGKIWLFPAAGFSKTHRNAELVVLVTRRSAVPRRRLWPLL
ncbi:putative glutathione S-transferase YghU [Citrobacter freundii]|nr:putative glutathione S-transferase YghU [Citrobacter freundii]